MRKKSFILNDHCRRHVSLNHSAPLWHFQSHGGGAAGWVREKFALTNLHNIAILFLWWPCKGSQRVHVHGRLPPTQLPPRQLPGWLPSGWFPTGQLPLWQFPTTLNFAVPEKIHQGGVIWGGTVPVGNCQCENCPGRVGRAEIMSREIFWVGIVPGELSRHGSEGSRRSRNCFFDCTNQSEIHLSGSTGGTGEGWSFSRYPYKSIVQSISNATGGWTGKSNDNHYKRASVQQN